MELKETIQATRLTTLPTITVYRAGSSQWILVLTLNVTIARGEDFAITNTVLGFSGPYESTPDPRPCPVKFWNTDPRECRDLEMIMEKCEWERLASYDTIAEVQPAQWSLS